GAARQAQHRAGALFAPRGRAIHRGWLGARRRSRGRGAAVPRRRRAGRTGSRCECGGAGAGHAVAAQARWYVLRRSPAPAGTCQPDAGRPIGYSHREAALRATHVPAGAAGPVQRPGGVQPGPARGAQAHRRCAVDRAGTGRRSRRPGSARWIGPAVPRPGVRRPAIAAGASELAKRDPLALRAQGHRARAGALDVRAGRLARDRAEAHSPGPRAHGRSGAGAVALSAYVRAVLGPLLHWFSHRAGAIARWHWKTAWPERWPAARPPRLTASTQAPPGGASNLSRWTFPARAASTSGYGSSISC